MSFFIWSLVSVLSWIVIFGGRVHVKWTRKENITFTLSLYSPRRRTRPQAIDSTESPSAEGAGAV